MENDYATKANGKKDIHKGSDFDCLIAGLNITLPAGNFLPFDSNATQLVNFFLKYREYMHGIQN